ncbi:MAG: DUF5691 domain-containing protein, partial [Chloroflexota bacterium]
AADHVMRLLLLHNDNRYWLDWLHMLLAEGHSLPAHWLDTVLLRLGDNVLARNTLVELADERGRWLQQFRPDWANIYADPSDDSDPVRWQGNFQRLRTANPTLARHMLAAKWPQLDADAQLDLLDAMFINLSDDDTEFIQSQLTSEHTWVRQTARELLMSLPDSDIAVQSVAWAAHFLTTHASEEHGTVVAVRTDDTAGPALPQQLHPDRYEHMDDVELQEITDNFHYILDDLPTDIPEDEQVYWRLFQVFRILELAPPAVWMSHYRVAAPDLIHMVIHSPWRMMFVQAWLLNRHSTHDHTWITHLVTACFNNHIFEAEAGTLAQHLPPTQREAYFQQYWDTQAMPHSYAAITLVHMMEKETWSEAFGHFMLTQLEAILQQESIPWGTVDRMLKAIQHHIDTRQMPQVRELVWHYHHFWMRHGAYWRADALLRTLRLRVAMEGAL